MILFEWVCFGGFQIGWVSNRQHWFLIGGLGGGCGGRCWLWFDGLCVCGSVDGSVCGVLCDEPVLEVEGG